MKIVRPYGKSNAGQPQGKAQHRRHLEARNKKSGSAPVDNAFEIHEFEDFNTSDPRIVIAQWISIIDRIFTKPKQGDLDSKNRQRRYDNMSSNDLRRKWQLEARTRLGGGCWALLCDRPELKDHDMSKYQKIWEQKLHPAGSSWVDFRSGNPETFTLRITGRWFKRFTGIEDISSEDELNAIRFGNLASAIEDHLYAAEKKAGDGKKAEGLIAARARSVSHSTVKRHLTKLGHTVTTTDYGDNIDIEHLKRVTSANGAWSWTPEDEARFTDRKRFNDVAKLIFDLCKEKEDAGKRLFYADVSKLIFTNYGRQFGNGETVPTRRDIVGKGDKGLLALYDAVKDFYKDLVKGSGKTSLIHALPVNNAALLSRLESKLTNSLTNDLIRIGKVLHYERSKGDDDKFGKIEVLENSEFSWDDLLASRYWTSDGQAEIKRAESFVRVWRSLLAQAQRTAQSYGDPQGAVSRSVGEPIDVTYLESMPAILGHEDVLPGTERFKTLLFGERADLFSSVPNIDFAYATLRLLGNVRNKAFHFKGRKAFISKLQSGFDGTNVFNIIRREKDAPGAKAFWSAAKSLLHADQTARHERLISELEGAGLQNYTGTRKLRSLVSSLQESSGQTILPRFNRMLRRVHNTDQEKFEDVKGWELPEPASRIDLNEFPALRAKFVALKSVYEGPFRAWCDDKLSADTLESIRVAALARTTKGAKTINKNSPHADLIVAKAESLGPVAKNDTLASYMDRLQADMASEQRLQKGYTSDSRAAREQAGWIEDFRMDMVGRAFKLYLSKQEAEFAWLLLLTRKSNPNPQPANWHEVKVGATKEDEDNPNWLVALYFILHLVPGYEVSRLLHQFRKWDVLEKKAGAGSGDPDVKALQALLTLYLDMNNDKHGGEGIGVAGLEPFHEMFEGRSDAFMSVFGTQGTDEERLGSTRRSLREILRYGNMNVLKTAARQSRVSNAEIVQFKSDVHDIAAAQHERKRLHAILTRKKDPETGESVNPNTEHFNDYVKALVKITTHRELSHKVNLTDMIKLHGVLISVVSRLIDYAGMWERDGYFIILALLKIHQISPGTALGSGADRFKKDGYLPKAQDIDSEFLDILSRFHTIKEAKLRNILSHFTVIAGDDVNLTQIINVTRRLMAYDRKMKNVISKSIHDLLDREGIEISWVMDVSRPGRHDLKLKSVGARQIKHLAKGGWKPHIKERDRNKKKKLEDRRNASLSEAFHDDKFMEALKSLFS